MARIFMLLGIVMLACVIIAGNVSAQNLFAETGQVIYNGSSIDTAGLKIGGWGSGSCEESNINTYSGSRSLKITPKDLYAGGRVDFVNPIDLTTAFNDPAMYLQLMCRFSGVQTGYDSWAVGVAAPNATDMYGGTGKTGKQVKKLRLALYFEDGHSTESVVELNGFKLGPDGWMGVSYPFAALKGKLDLKEYKIKRLVVTGDGSEPFYIGEIHLFKDRTAFQPNAGDEQEVARNYNIVFRGECQSGATPMKYSWDFDDKDGIQEEAIGDLIYHRFNKAGEFTATLTVSDPFGVKESASTTVHVVVNQ